MFLVLTYSEGPYESPGSSSQLEAFWFYLNSASSASLVQIFVCGRNKENKEEKKRDRSKQVILNIHCIIQQRKKIFLILTHLSLSAVVSVTLFISVKQNEPVKAVRTYSIKLT